jgi:phage tail-like protein
MARLRADDFLQGHNFWVFEFGASPKPPFVVLNPIVGAAPNPLAGSVPFLSGGLVGGFSAVSLPELTASTASVSPINQSIPTTYVTGYEVGSVTLRRGVSRYDSSFYLWMLNAMRGTDKPHRNLMILHLSSAAISEEIGSQAAPVGAGYVEVIKTFGKAYLLYDCIPTRYSLGGDLDASSADIMIAELEVAPNYFEEYSLDPLLAV